MELSCVFSGQVNVDIKKKSPRKTNEEFWGAPLSAYLPDAMAKSYQGEQATMTAVFSEFSA
jgi:hypothetical protein